MNAYTTQYSDNNRQFQRYVLRLSKAVDSLDEAVFSKFYRKAVDLAGDKRYDLFLSQCIPLFHSYRKNLAYHESVERVKNADSQVVATLADLAEL